MLCLCLCLCQIWVSGSGREPVFSWRFLVVCLCGCFSSCIPQREVVFFFHSQKKKKNKIVAARCARHVLFIFSPCHQQRTRFLTGIEQDSKLKMKRKLVFVERTVLFADTGTVTRRVILVSFSHLPRDLFYHSIEIDSVQTAIKQLLYPGHGLHHLSPSLISYPPRALFFPTAWCANS